MKASEFIKKLQQLVELHGDQEVTVFDPDKWEEGELSDTPAAIILHCGHNDVVKGFTIADRETALGFT